MRSNTIHDLFNQVGYATTKYSNYLSIYESLFRPWQERPITIVEFGVLNGGSLQLWKQFFHPGSRIIGVDANPECRRLEELGVEIFLVDQESNSSLDNFWKRVGNVDIVIDDGAHTNVSTVKTFLSSLEHINHPGLYICEDTQTSFDPLFGNPSRNSFISIQRNLVEFLGKAPCYKFGIQTISFTSQCCIIHFTDPSECVSLPISNGGTEFVSSDFRYFRSRYAQFFNQVVGAISDTGFISTNRKMWILNWKMLPVGAGKVLRILSVAFLWFHHRVRSRKVTKAYRNKFGF